MKIELSRKEINLLMDRHGFTKKIGVLTLKLHPNKVNYFESISDLEGIIGIDPITIDNLLDGIPYDVAGVFRIEANITECCQADKTDQNTCTECKQRV